MDFVQENTIKTLEERKFLRKRLLNYEPDTEKRKRSQNHTAESKPVGVDLLNLEPYTKAVKIEQSSPVPDIKLEFNGDGDDQEVDLAPNPTIESAYAINNRIIQSLGERAPTLVASQRCPEIRASK